MKTIKWYLSIGYANAVQEDIFEVEDTATDEEIEEIAKEIVWGYIDWNWRVQ